MQYVDYGEGPVIASRFDMVRRLWILIELIKQLQDHLGDLKGLQRSKARYHCFKCSGRLYDNWKGKGL
jgi:hypothetical protein